MGFFPSAITAELPTGPEGIESNNVKWPPRCSHGPKPALISNLVMLKKEDEEKRKGKKKNRNQKKNPEISFNVSENCKVLLVILATGLSFY